MNNIIAVDTDNAIVRVYPSRARALGLLGAGIVQLRRDAEAIAAALGHLAGVRFRVEVMS